MGAFVTPAPKHGIFLLWDKGQSPETTISNLTTGTSIYAGLADGLLYYPLPAGSSNRFVAFNTNGLSNEASGVAAGLSRNSEIAIYSYLVTVPVKTNITNWVMTSTNLLTWRTIALIVPTNTSHQFVWTNDFGNRWFRTAIP